MKTVMSIYTTIFFFTIAGMIAFANVVADPVLYLNAADNPAHPTAWKNLGTEGGELLEADKAPELEEGTIKNSRARYQRTECEVLHNQGIPSNFWRAAS